MISTQYINLDMTPSGVLPVLYCSQYDVGRPLGFVVHNGGEAVDLSAYTCTIEATRTDGTAITAAVTTDGNIGAFVTTATMTNQKDRYPAKLVIVDGDGNRVASLAFVMMVTPATMDENAEGIEEDKTLYQQYTETVQTLIAEIREDIAGIRGDIAEIREDVADLQSQTHNIVADMKSDTNLKAGMYVRTGGYYAVNDGGAALYRIYATAPDTYYETLSNGLYAALITGGVVCPEMFGAKGDGVTNDYASVVNAINYAVQKQTNVQFATCKTFLLSSQLQVPENISFCGCCDTYGSTTTLACPNGIKLAGRHITFKDFIIQGSGSQTGLYCCGNNEGGEVTGANHFSMNRVERLVVNDFAIGMHFNAVVWETVISQVRFNRCETAINNTSAYNMLTTRFESVYISASRTKNILLNKASATFLNCNFGISVVNTIGFYQNCNVVMIGCNFECDAPITGTGVIVEITGDTLALIGCNFYCTTAATVNFLNTGAAVDSVAFDNFMYKSVDMSTYTNAFKKFFSDSITAVRVGAITVSGGSIPDFIHDNNTRLPYGKMQFCKDASGIIKVYNSEYIDTARTPIGTLVYFIQTKEIKVYNGTSFV